MVSDVDLHPYSAGGDGGAHLPPRGGIVVPRGSISMSLDRMPGSGLGLGGFGGVGGSFDQPEPLGEAVQVDIRLTLG